MESIFLLVLTNYINIEILIINENWPRFDNNSDVNTSFQSNLSLYPVYLV